MEQKGKLLTTRDIATNDYYEKNIHAKTLMYVPIYFFDIMVTKEDTFTVTIKSANECLMLQKILILAPNGRVIASTKNKREITFKAEQLGKYTVKYWVNHKCDGTWWNFRTLNENAVNLHDETVEKDHRHDHDAIHNLEIYSHNILDSLSLPETKIRVYNLLGSHKQGALHKGEKIKEKCAERYIPAKQN
jgi:hypothetical protein